MNRTYAFRAKWKQSLARNVDAIASCFFNVSEPREGVKPYARIVVVRLDHLGDLICTLPFLQKLKSHYPTAHLTLLTTPSAKIMLRDIPFIDEILPFEPSWFQRGSARRLWPIRELRVLSQMLKKGRFDICIDLRGDLRHLWVSAMARIPWRLGYGQTGGKFLLHTCLDWNPEDHAIVKNIRFLKPLGVPPIVIETFVPPPELIWKPSPEDHSWLQKTVGTEPYMVYHIGAGTPAKEWKTEYFLSILSHLRSTKGTHVIVGFGENISFDLTSIENRSNILDLVNKTTLPQLLTLIQRAKAVMSADSGPAHMAAALRRPVLVLWSGTTSPNVWRPIGEGVCIQQKPVPCQYCQLSQCPLPTHPCMDEITPERVLPIWQDLIK